MGHDPAPIPAGKPATCDLLHKSPTMTNPALTRHGNDYVGAGKSHSHPVGLANCAGPAWLPRIQDPRDARGPILPPLFCSFVHNVPKGLTIAIYGVRALSGDAEVDRVLCYTPSHIFRPGFVDHIGERAVRADYPPHTGIGFIWNNMREGFDVGHRAILQPCAIRQEPEDGNT